MRYIKKIEDLDIEKSTYKSGDIVKIISNGDIRMIYHCGVLNMRYVYILKTYQGKKIMQYYFDADIVPATDQEKNEYYTLEKAEKYNL